MEQYPPLKLKIQPSPSKKSYQWISDTTITASDITAKPLSLAALAAEAIKVKVQKQIQEELQQEEKLQVVEPPLGYASTCKCDLCTDYNNKTGGGDGSEEYQKQKQEVAAVEMEKLDEKELPPSAASVLPNGEEWVKAYFPKGSKILFPLRSLKALMARVQRIRKRYPSLAEYAAITQWRSCVACNYGLSHTFPHDDISASSICRCGCLWIRHTGHNCGECGLEKCYPIASVSGHWVEIPEKLTRTVVEGCTCRYCVRENGLKGKVAKPPSKPPKGAITNPIAAEYGLDPNLILVESAADFYLGIEMGAMQPLGEEVNDLFTRGAGRLAEQLCLYLELASLGEFRYSWEEGRRGWMDGYKVTAKTKTKVEELVERLRSEGGGERMTAWSLWKEYQKPENFGKGLHQLLIDGFRGMTWSRKYSEQTVSVGGPRWAACIEAAKFYRDGLPAAVFIDMALSLRHNGNIAYNKFFDVSGLDHVINWALLGDTRSIQHYASEKMRKLWQVWRKR